MNSGKNCQTVETTIMTTLTQLGLEAAALKWLAWASSAARHLVARKLTLTCQGVTA